MLTLQNVHAAYGYSRALHGVDLTIAEGEVVCLVGRNGAGKTSTMRAIVHDLIHVVEGSVTFRDRPLNDLPPHQVVQQGIGYVPEDRRVFPSLSVADNLVVPSSYSRERAAMWTVERVYELFPMLREFRSRLAGNLSGGQQQMLAIGRSLLTNPALLLLDEPHEGLAPLVARQVVEAVNELKAAGVSMLISEQHLHLVHGTADRIYVIDRGTTVFTGTMEAFEREPEIAEKYLMVM